jgi:hypothetical protein
MDVYWTQWVWVTVFRRDMPINLEDIRHPHPVSLNDAEPSPLILPEHSPIILALLREDLAEQLTEYRNSTEFRDYLEPFLNLGFVELLAQRVATLPIVSEKIKALLKSIILRMPALGFPYLGDKERPVLITLARRVHPRLAEFLLSPDTAWKAAFVTSNGLRSPQEILEDQGITFNNDPALAYLLCQAGTCVDLGPVAKELLSKKKNKEMKYLPYFQISQLQDLILAERALALPDEPLAAQQLVRAAREWRATWVPRENRVNNLARVIDRFFNLRQRNADSLFALSLSSGDEDLLCLRRICKEIVQDLKEAGGERAAREAAWANSLRCFPFNRSYLLRPLVPVTVRDVPDNTEMVAMELTGKFN